jgi:DNA repair protein RadC
MFTTCCDVLDYNTNNMLDNKVKYEKMLDSISLVREESNIKKYEIKSPQMIVDIARKFYGNDIDIQESFYAIFLDNSMQILGFSKIGQGGLTSCNVDIRLICKYAINTLCTRVITVHNHPSGKLKESQADINVCTKIKKGLELFNIQLEDNIIVTKTSHINFDV